MVHTDPLCLLCGQGVAHVCVQDLGLTINDLDQRFIQVDRQLNEKQCKSVFMGGLGAVYLASAGHWVQLEEKTVLAFCTQLQSRSERAHKSRSPPYHPMTP